MATIPERDNLPILPPSSSSEAESSSLDRKVLLSGQKLAKHYGTSGGAPPILTAPDASILPPETRETAAAAALGNSGADSNPSCSYSTEMNIVSAPISNFSIGSPSESILKETQKNSKNPFL